MRVDGSDPAGVQKHEAVDHRESSGCLIERSPALHSQTTGLAAFSVSGWWTLSKGELDVLSHECVTEGSLTEKLLYLQPSQGHWIMA